MSGACWQWAVGCTWRKRLLIWGCSLPPFTYAPRSSHSPFSTETSLIQPAETVVVLYCTGVFVDTPPCKIPTVNVRRIIRGGLANRWLHILKVILQQRLHERPLSHVSHWSRQVSVHRSRQILYLLRCTGNCLQQVANTRQHAYSDVLEPAYSR